VRALCERAAEQGRQTLSARASELERDGTVRLTMIMIDIANANTKCQLRSERENHILCLL
jgi:hypothetical protein